MKTNVFLRFVVKSIIVSLLAMQATFASGFHYQLDLTAKLVNNPQGELTAIQMSWLYDKELSAILMDGEDLSEENREETLKKRAANILQGLSEVKYFTTALLDKRALQFEAVKNYNLRLSKASRLQLNLTLPLKKPQALKGHTLKLLVSDDSAVGVATFVDTSHLLLSEKFKAMCKPPELSQKKSAEVDGHAQVTETMTINCR